MHMHPNFVNRRDVTPIQSEGHQVYKLLGQAHGCVAGCRTGVSVYTVTEYPAAGTHEHQEGFYVLAGSGLAHVGQAEFRLEPGISFLVPPGTLHCIKKDADSAPLEVFWFHAAA